MTERNLAFLEGALAGRSAIVTGAGQGSDATSQSP